MCGINGIFPVSGIPDARDRIEAMNDALRHRGPDGHGVHLDGTVALGHRRLSIIDLSEYGKQPMADSSGSIWATFNGEIYNFKDIRRELTAKGHTFASTSDTETVVLGYKEWGPAIFEKLEGMFAIGLWDAQRQSLYLARDACGIKPLFYCFTGKTLVFSSEIKGLLASGLVQRDMDMQSLSNFLSLFYVPGPETILKNVQQVSPGNVIRFSMDRGPETTVFWGLNNLLHSRLPAMPEKELLELLRAEISTAVEQSLVSDVPVSLLLSSGLDSSIILSELKRLGRSDIETITIGFKEDSYDEGKVARALAGEMGFKHHLLQMPEFDLPRTIEKIIYHVDALNANPCLLAEFVEFGFVSEQFKVTIMGSGNDELFAGYPTYIANEYRKYFGLLPMSFRKIAHAAANLLPARDKKYSFDYFSKKFTEGSLYPPFKSHYCWRTIFTEREKEMLLKPGVLKNQNAETDSYHTFGRFFEATEGRMSFEQSVLFADFQNFLIDNANMEVDQLSMAFSLEARPPFLTKRFLEFAFAMPYSMKLRNRKTKYCLRKAYEGVLPDYILNRKKHGLITPLEMFFDKKNLPYTMETITTRQMRDIFDIKFTEKLVSDHLKKKNNNSYKIYSLLCLSLWMSHFVRQQ